MGISLSAKEILSLIRKGAYERARELLPQLKEESELAYFCRVFLQLYFKAEKTDITAYQNLFPDSVYLRYFLAYLALLANREEEALYHYTQLADFKQGWLAREFIEKARQNQLLPLVEREKVSFFVPLPEEVTNNFLKFKIPHKLKFIYQSKIIYFIFTIILLIVLASFFFKPKQRAKAPWENLELDETAHIIPFGQGGNPYRYENREDMKRDFLKARESMYANRFNKARYYLQRLIYSNADFRSREKAKIFLNFIPEPDYESFNDNIPAEDLLNESIFYTNCYLLWEGTMHVWKKENNGYRGSLVVRENDKNFLVELFWPQKENDSKKDIRPNLPAKAIVFGQFKGLIGKQKLIYLEALRVAF